MLSDAEVIEQSWTDPRRFELVFVRHHHAIRTFLARRIGVEAADDLAAQTFVTAFESRRRYKTDRADARPWLYGIATNVLRRHYRTEQRRLRAIARMGEEAPSPSPGEDEVVAKLDAERLAPAIAAALLALSKKTRDVLVLIAWEGLTYGETADALGISQATVRSRLHQARQKLRNAPAFGGQYPTEIDRPGLHREAENYE